MKINRVIPTGVLPCSSNYRSETQPYYIVAPAYDHKSGGIRLLHDLCSLLNQLGYEAYMDSPGLSGNLWTPVLTPLTRLAHYRAGKKPIVVYPEVVKGQPMGLGLPVRYVLNYPGYLGGGDRVYAENEAIYTYLRKFYPEGKLLFLPIVNLEQIRTCVAQAQGKRSGVAYYHNRYTKAGGALRDFGPDAIEISSTTPDSHEKTLAVLSRVELLYSYEWSAIVIEAILSGCPVVLLPNPQTLAQYPEILSELGSEGIAWGDDPAEIARARETVVDGEARFLEGLRHWQQQLLGFIEDTQRQATELPQAAAWPPEAVDGLPLADLSAKDLAARSDRAKYRRLHGQYLQWKERSSLREIDADIYAEHLAAGRVARLALVVDHRAAPNDALADTLDSVGACLGQPAEVVILSHQPAPEALLGAGVRWVVLQGDADLVVALGGLDADWALLVQSGTKLMAHALMEWGLAPATSPQAALIYADEEHWDEQTQIGYPQFKPDANIELLRCTNYLGSAVLVRTPTWRDAGCPLFDGALYALGLALTRAHGRSALGHVDTILYRAPTFMPAGVEDQEFGAVRRQLVDQGLADKVSPLERWGAWLVQYKRAPQARVSLVVPTGVQTGYLRSLLESLQRYPQAQIAELVLVCEPEHVPEVEYALSDQACTCPVHIVTLEQPEYNHAAALNAGIARASGDFVLVCDDDTEALHSNWLDLMVGIARQADVGCVAPRLMATKGKDGKVVGGPAVLGLRGTVGGYTGEEQRIEEAGVYSRLQLTQDVGAVTGHCFLFKKADWAAVGGFDVQTFNLYYPVLDFCLRLAQLGRRHVWTPLTGMLHQGGKTFEYLARMPKKKIRLIEREYAEGEALLSRWAVQLANDPCYNRHLSLNTPYDVDADIVVDWQPKRHDRPRALALPLRSGAGQYRVMDPLNALQDAGLAQSCVVLPMKNGLTRILKPLEVVRAAPDRLVLQHSVDDGQLSLIDQYKKAMPSIKIVQMVDDLLGFVPEKHPNRQFQSREGHQRMMHALNGSDLMIVTTEPLEKHYSKYVPAVRRVPNTLTEAWLGLRRPRAERKRLRIGWVGAAQHQGDLELVTDVIRQLAPEVDWVFMGMCTDAIRPCLKEFHSFVSISEYPKKMSELDLDIAIAPLENNFFNECKSNLRLLEYGAMGWPVVCSDVFPYRTDNPPVIRCADDPQVWLAALRALINDTERRREMGEHLHQWVLDNYLLKDKVSLWRSSLFDEQLEVMARRT